MKFSNQESPLNRSLKMSNPIKYVCSLIFGLALGWALFGRDYREKADASSAADTSGTILFYRSPMHPWVKSDTPGQCTVCGMDLVPVFAGAVTDGNLLSTDLSDSAKRIVGLATDPVKHKEMTKTLHVSGWLRENDDVTRTVTARVPGRIETLSIRYDGQEISSGDKLYSIYSPKLLEWEKEYNLLYRQSQMNHTSRITAEHGRLLKAMRQRLLQHGLLRKQIDELPNKPENISVTDILSPASGLVMEHFVDEGDYVEEGDPLMRVVDLFRLWFEFDVYDGDVGGVSLGQKVTLDLVGENRRNLDGVISFINVKRDTRSRSSRARVEIQNAAVRVQGKKTRPFDPNTYAEGRIRIRKEGALSVARSAVLSRDGGYAVFVETEGGQLQRRAVTIGFKGDDHWEVIGGVTNGTRVVTQGSVVLDSHLRL